MGKHDPQQRITLLYAREGRLSRSMRNSPKSLDLLAKKTLIPKSTLQHWRSGRTVPKRWASALPVIYELGWPIEELEYWLADEYDLDLATACDCMPPDKLNLLRYIDKLHDSERNILQVGNDVSLISSDHLREALTPILDLLREPHLQVRTPRVPNPEDIPALQLVYTDRSNPLLKYLHIYWCASYANGSIYVEVATLAPFYWITLREVRPNPKIWGLFPHPGYPEGDDALAAAMGVLIGDVMEIGIGAGRQMPRRTEEDVPLVYPKETYLYKITRTGDLSCELEVVFDSVVT